MGEINVDEVVEVVAVLKTEIDGVSVISKLSYAHTDACYDQNTGKIFIILATEQFCLFYKTSLEDLTQKEHEIDYSQVLTIREARKIMIVNSQQILIHSKYSLLVFRYMIDNFDEDEKSPCKLLVGHNVDFKLKMEQVLNDVSTSQSVISVVFGS